MAESFWEGFNDSGGYFNDQSKLNFEKVILRRLGDAKLKARFSQWRVADSRKKIRWLEACGGESVCTLSCWDELSEIISSSNE